MVRLAVTGAAGRTGSRIIELASTDKRFEVSAALEITGHPRVGGECPACPGLPIQDRTETEFDVLIDFTVPAGTMHWLDYCLTCRRPMVIGTTGHSPDQLAEIQAAAAAIPILKAANMSVGINLLLTLVGRVAAALGEDYDIEIVEAHHRFKVDAPSGTALALRDAITGALSRNPDKDVVYGRLGHTGPRPRTQIGIHALRIGDTIGEHEVHFGNLGETLVVRHVAHTRDTFALGALRAAAWLAHRPAGLYSMHDVIGR